MLFKQIIFLLIAIDTRTNEGDIRLCTI